MPRRAFILCLAVALTALPQIGRAAGGAPADGWGSAMENRPVMGDLVLRASAGDRAAWKDISEIWNTYPLDASTGETFSAAMGELFARNPVIFLDAYLAGDKNAVDLVRVGWVWYGEQFDHDYHGETICQAARTLFLARVQIGRPAERRRTRAFVDRVFEPGSAKIREKPYPRQPPTARWPKRPRRPQAVKRPT